MNNINISHKKVGWFINIYLNQSDEWCKPFSIMVSDITELYFQGSKINTYPGYFKNVDEFVWKIRKYGSRIRYVKTENWGMTEEFFFKDGQLSRLWGPAIEYKFKGTIKDVVYFLNGKGFSEDDYWKMPKVKRFTRKLKIEMIRRKK